LSHSGLLFTLRRVPESVMGTKLFSTVQQTTFCSSPSIGMAAQQDGKYIILITGTIGLNGAPTLFILMQN
jgi:hypothetical protein